MEKETGCCAERSGGMKGMRVIGRGKIPGYDGITYRRCQQRAKLLAVQYLDWKRLSRTIS